MVAVAPITIYNHFWCINHGYPAHTIFAHVCLLLLIVLFFPYLLFSLWFFFISNLNLPISFIVWKGLKHRRHSETLHLSQQLTDAPRTLLSLESQSCKAQRQSAHGGYFPSG
jgi:hypothetical protein